MFYQVRLHPDDRNAVQFLWWVDGNPHKAVVKYKMCVHAFGLTSSPFVATNTLRQAAFNNAVGLSDRAVATALDAFYVVDLLTSANTKEELVLFIDELGRLLSSRGFHLTKYSKNSERVLATVRRDRLAPWHRNFEFGNLSTGKALGVAYNAATGDFVAMAKIEERPMTKRGVVLMTSQFFDPIGFLQPYLVVAKLIVQRVRKDVPFWDDDIGDDNQAAMKD